MLLINGDQYQLKLNFSNQLHQLLLVRHKLFHTDEYLI